MGTPKMNVFYCQMQGLLKVHITLCVCVCVCVRARECACTHLLLEEGTQGFHQSPEGAFDPSAAKKHSIIKRFNVFESLLFHQVVQIFYDVH